MIDYDPYSDEAMRDPFALYKRLREEAPLFYMEKYDCWAFSRFEDIWSASLDQDHFTATGGQSPGQVMLGEAIPHTFMTMDPPEHRMHRSIIGADYARKAVERDAPRIRSLAREILGELLPRGEFEVYSDYANRVTTLNAAHMAGVPLEDAEQVRRWIDGFLEREAGQVGTSQRNADSAGQLDAYFRDLIRARKKTPAQASGHLAQWLHAEVGGKPLSEDSIAANLLSLIVTGSETTPLAVAGTLVYLSEDPAQRDLVLGDLSHVGNAFSECLRFDQPTNMLARKVVSNVEFGEAKLSEGQGVLFLYASANRDALEFPNPDVYEVLRCPRRTLSFGHGVHKCLGEHVGMTLGVILLEELLESVGQFDLDAKSCARIYGEFLSGYNRVPIRFEPTELAD